MRAWLRTLLLALLLAATALAAGLLAAGQLGSERVRASAERSLAATLGSPVRLASARLRVGRRGPAFEAEGLEAFADAGEPALRVERVSTRIDPLSLMLGQDGGVVHEHGLAASQLARIRDRNIPLTVTVDKVAASGGYLMACVANRVVAAPFAILGSIGVIAQIPNFNRMLDSHGVDFEQITAGQYKRNVTMFGKNTDADRAKLKDELEDVHALFKSAVGKYRPDLDLAKVATGEHWYGTRALELGLADELRTSDELLAEAAKDRDLYRVSFKIKQPLQKRLLANVDGVLEKVDAAGWRRRFESRLPR